ncbi:GH3 auxin-responsive promoter family protein [Marivirga sp. S37H4]|uniref:GH3 auxin-responsive promoter family protein n=1 Tax=Marivirga aurantiaca TaxID=2802615 RepID=A0A934WVB4_9BACT|nr:GH3 auxin-responsive promoter family protein [Marivirga aurantiaca]MBK6263699.1 GH3 auxin-responsive promoter family protein [Marivirga aurantiaca]
MALLGNLIKRGIRIREGLDQDFTPPFDLQKSELRKMLIAARNTQFGKHYDFNAILLKLKSYDNKAFYEAFSQHVPIHTYDKMYEDWWYKLREGEKDVTWPGKIKYFALSSGTSGASSKHIPVSLEMVKAIQKTSVRQILSLSRYEGLPSKVFEGGTLMVGGSTDLNDNGNYAEGDLSGITTSRIPYWFQRFYKPGKAISRKKDWEEKLEQMTLKAKDWNITIIAGVPAWIQILLEKIIKHYNVAHIHEIWPNFEIYVHGGVAFEPYQKSFEKLLGRKINYINTYLASEGFIAFQANQGVNTMRLVLNNGIFYEFIPFNEKNFDEDGNLLDNPETVMIDDVEEGKDYALLISTFSGAWRYLIGDTIRFVSRTETEIVITGRTKHFLSLCGEHLSVDNMNKALIEVSHQLGFSMKEFTVAGVSHDSLFAHHWFIGIDDKVDVNMLRDQLDAKLKELNDDYAVERTAALKDIKVTVLPTNVFIEYMEELGKVGGQNKFPRVMKGDKLESWLNYLSNRNLV